MINTDEQFERLSQDISRVEQDIDKKMAAVQARLEEVDKRALTVRKSTCTRGIGKKPQINAQAYD